MKLHSLPFVVLVVALIAAALPARAHGAVNVERSGSENPMVEVARSTLYGGLAGLMLGGAIALVSDGNDGDTVKWGFAGGTFAGLGFGLWHVLHRPQPVGLLHLEHGRARFAVAPPRPVPGGGLALDLVSLRF